MKLFEFRPHTRSLIDKTSGTVPTNTSVVFRRLEKGYAAHFSAAADLDGFGTVTGVKTVVMVIKPTANTKLLQDNGADKLEIAAGNISGTGLTECTVNTIDTDAVSIGVWSLVVAEFSGGIDFSTDFEIDPTAEVGIVSIVCYDEILSGLQKGKLWDEFNHLSPVSTPTIIRHHIEVTADDSCMGSEIVTNGDFATGAWWSLDPGVTIGGGTCNFDTAGYASVYKANQLTVGKKYVVTFEIKSLVSGNVVLVRGVDNG